MIRPLEMCDTIEIKVKSQYLPEQSIPDENRYVFSYIITIANHGVEQVQLISRHWIITDETSAVQEVKGLGVVGQQPFIDPGQSYTYNSGAVLATPTGTMEGSYQMQSATQNSFEVAIPTFALIPPEKLH